MKLGLIVEGHGEVAAAPILLRRLASAIGCPEPTIDRPFRVKRHRIVKENELERAVELVARQVGTGGAVMILLDADDDLPCQLGPHLLARARKARRDRHVSVVLAQMEFESWFLAGASSLAAAGVLTAGTTAPPASEAIRDAKGWLSARMEQRYSETLDQPRMASALDLRAAEAAPSFRKLKRDLVGLLAAEPGDQGRHA